MTGTEILREQLMALIDGVGAHMPFDQAVAGFPAEAMNLRPPNVTYTPWHLVEHLRLTQRDILEYITNRAYVEPRWPDDYWPAGDATATPEQWGATVDGFRADQAAIRALVADPETDLLATIPGTPGHTILREVRILGDHNAYHVGELAILRQVTGSWPADREG